MPCEKLHVDLSPFAEEIPTELHFGRGTFGEAARHVRHLGRHALLVTGRQAMDRLGLVEQLSRALGTQDIRVTRFANLHPSPTTDSVDGGAAVCRRCGADFIIALGGGSVIDCGKAIAAVAPAQRPATDYLYGLAAPGKDTLPVVAIPTTSGTGSELNRSAIIADAERRFKDGIRGNQLFPRLAIVDATLTCSLDRLQTAQTGFDCLSHAVESYVSPKAKSDTDQLALRAIHYVSQYLPAVLEDPDDLAGREKLAVASTTMGVNLSCVGTCFPHRVDKALCALHPEIPHGQSVAAFYPHWISFSYHGNVDRFAQIAQIMAPEVTMPSPVDMAAALSGIIGEFLGRVGLQRSPADCGVSRDEIPELTKRVTGDLSVNPVPVKRDELPELLRQAFTYNEAHP